MDKTGLKCVGGVWLPEGEHHMDDWMLKRNQVVNGKLTYQYHKLAEAMHFVKNFDHAVDIGAHCGLWSMHLAEKFKRLDSFEPMPLHRRCFNLNVGMPREGVTLHAMALGKDVGRVAMYSTPGSTGDTYVDKTHVDANTDLQMLDNILPPSGVDFIKLDCEGYELFALQGGEKLLIESRPCIVVEQKPNKAPKYGLGTTDAVAYLQKLGAKLRKEIGGDYIMSWDK